jgi:UrcA family protein
MGVSFLFTQRRDVMKKFATKMLLLGGLAGIAAAGAAQASGFYSDVPALVVHYNPEMLATDSGAHTIYRLLTQAAVEVCPGEATGTRIIGEKIVNCRRQAVAAAVEKIHNQRLAAVYARATKSAG